MKFHCYIALFATTTLVTIAAPISAQAQVQTHYQNCMNDAADDYLDCMGGAALGGVTAGALGSLGGPMAGAAAGMSTFAVGSVVCTYQLVQNTCDEAGPAQPMTSQSGDVYHNTGHWEGVPGASNNYDWMDDPNPGDMVFMENGDIWERR